MLRNYARTLLPESIRERLALNYQALGMWLRNFHANPPILIYQMGKVGSSTIHLSLEAAKVPNPIYHVHFLSDEGIRKSEAYYHRRSAPLPRHLRFSRILRRRIERVKTQVQWMIVTSVREPVGREISDFFQNVEADWPHLLDRNGKLRTNDAVPFLRDMLMAYDESTDYATTWFDQELKAVFGVDVYAYPFNHDSGYTIIRQGNVDVLVFRVDALNTCFESATTEFLGLDEPIKMLRANIGEDKPYAQEYRDMVSQFALPEAACHKIFASKYARHFFDEHVRDQSIRRWAEEQN
jgi:hypothetical protein